MTWTLPSSSRSRRRNQQAVQLVREGDTPFRVAERFWKSRVFDPDLSRALSVDAIVWQERDERGRQRGVWNGAGVDVECVKIELGALDQMGQSKWKGKGKDVDEVDFAVLVPAIPGLVLLPSLLPIPLQRALTVESLRHSVLPNLTSLSAHYDLPSDGLWPTFEAGRGAEIVFPVEVQPRGAPRRERVDLEPVTKDNWKEVTERGAKILEEQWAGVKEEKGTSAAGVKPATVAELIPRLRWTTIGWSYNWTSKAYDFDRPQTPLPPLTYRCCRDAVRAVPWEDVFGAEVEGEGSQDGEDWRKWATEYVPEAGVYNFYQLKDSLTAHIDQSEVDAVRPLISFSLGHSAIFLVGGPTRETSPLAIRLDSGDGLIMSGHAGRRVFHGLPRVIADSLPPHLAPDAEGCGVDWRPFGEYLQAGARINVNVRAVF